MEPEDGGACVCRFRISGFGFPVSHFLHSSVLSRCTSHVSLFTINDAPRHGEDTIEHLSREEPGLCVALARVIRGDECDVTQVVARGVCKPGQWLWHGLAECAAGLHVRVEGDTAECHHDAYPVQQLQLVLEVRPAILELLLRGLV